MSDRLIALLGGRAVGEVVQSRGKLELRYDSTWTRDSTAYPISVSMPLARDVHPDEVVHPWLEGLLPDSDVVLRSWARQFGASARNPFSLLTHVGEDLPGAVQLLTPERAKASAESDGTIMWLDEADIGERLRGLIENQAAWRSAGDTGYFSLAGAQPKTALLFREGRWGVPSGRIPTTHILKPPVLEGLDHLEVNEHLCLRLAGALGIPAANSTVKRFDGQSTLVVERYDRVLTSDGFVRVHQEDFCQALGVSPRSKYENEGGPTVTAIVELLRDHSASPSADLERLVDTLALYWAIGATDAHAKNYSILMAPGSLIRLAPIYDVLSVLPYPERFYSPTAKLAMRIGGEYRLGHIARRHWERLAREASLDPGAVLERATRLIRRVPAVLSELCGAARGEGLPSGFLGRFEAAVAKHAEQALIALERE